MGTASCMVRTLESPIGPLVAAARDDGVCLLEFSEPGRLASQMGVLRRLFGGEPMPGQHRYLERLAEELEAYFAGALTRFTVPVITPGTPFQERVWSELMRIPYGETRSYEELARSLGNAQAQRAVGHANGTNRVAIVVPCHRVINKNGKLGGYGGSLWRKDMLLRLERGSKSESSQARLFA
jgi:AraC family transcriptional regulator of adaptative response/methylated-DNA-[protein]-cysteine methyltransferase